MNSLLNEKWMKWVNKGAVGWLTINKAGTCFYSGLSTSPIHNPYEIFEISIQKP